MSVHTILFTNSSKLKKAGAEEVPKLVKENESVIDLTLAAALVGNEGIGITNDIYTPTAAAICEIFACTSSSLKDIDRYDNCWV